MGAAASCSYVALPGGLIVNFPLAGEPLSQEEVGTLRVPRGFSVTSYADGIPNARMLRFTRSGDLLVTAPREGKIVLLEKDRDGDGRSDGQRVLLSGLDLPHGIALHGDWLYIGETGAVRRIRLSAEKGEVQGELEPVVTGLPPGGRHWTKTIGIGPDEHLYVSVGSSCNACIEEDPRRAAITRYTLDGENEEPYATGLRNSVGFAWDPKTGVMWATDNNRDLLGDDFPPCELNRVVEGASFGWPYANGDRIPDPDFDEGFEAEIAASLPPALDLGAHTAPLGITFYDHEGEGFPEEYRDAAFVALHGSWNRSKKIGYEVVAVHADENGSLRHEPFFTGFLSEDDVSGRPVDVAVGPDGALYVSDDYAGQVYRIAWGEDRAGGVIPAAARGAREIRWLESRPQKGPGPGKRASLCGTRQIVGPATVPNAARDSARSPISESGIRSSLSNASWPRPSLRCRSTRSTTSSVETSPSIYWPGTEVRGAQHGSGDPGTAGDRLRFESRARPGLRRVAGPRGSARRAQWARRRGARRGHCCAA